jgi:hypothetical protein
MPHKTAAARKAYHAARYRRKRAAIKAQHHAYYEAHREAIAAAARAKRRTPEAIAAKAEYDRSPVQRARAAAASANERARMYGVDGQISAETVLELWRREPACLDCGVGFGLDHIVSMSAGGSNTSGNLANRCHGCNSRKYQRSKRVAA